MQTVSANLKAKLDVDARITPHRWIDLYEFYASDYVPGAAGFDPDDAIESFAAEEITWNGNAYRREVVSRGDIVRSMNEKTNSVSLTFSNISRYAATWAQSQPIEGLFGVIRCVDPSVTDDSLVLIVGRCEKPSDIDKKTFSLSIRQDFGNINQTLPPRKFTAEDPEGRTSDDPLFEGILFHAIAGSFSFPEVIPKTGFAGLIGRRRTVTQTEQWSSADATPYGSVIPEVFGRCQMQLIPFAWADKGVFVSYLMAAAAGPIFAIENVKTRTEEISDPYSSLVNRTPAIVHLGDAGGTGTNTGNFNQADLAGGQVFSHLAYIEGASIPSVIYTNPNFSDPNVLNEPPTVTALIMGRLVDVPDASGAYTETAWSDNPVHIARFILTHPAFVNIDPAFMEDAVNYLTALHCDQPLMDETSSQLIIVSSPDIDQAGQSFSRFRSTGLYTPQYFLYNYLGDVSVVPEIQDGPYISYNSSLAIEDPPVRCPIGEHHDPVTGECVPDVPIGPGPGPGVINVTQPLLRKRYTVSCPITDEVRAVDFLYKTIFPAAKLFMRVNKRGKYEIRTEKPSDATRIRSATAVGDTSIPVLDVTPWKSGPDLLAGRLLLGMGVITAEVRDVSSAGYSTSGNLITLAATDTGGVTATASGATLSGGSTTVQASGTVTIGGTPGAGDMATITIDGIGVAYILSGADDVNTTAAMLAAYINATPRLARYIVAVWDSGTPTVITIRCLHGALNLSAALLKAHTGPIADPTSAPTVAAAASGALGAGDYNVAYADETATGLTALTAIATVTLTANQKIDVSTLPAFPAGVTGRQFFVSQSPGSTNLRYLVTRANASDFSINSLPANGAALPPSYNSTAEELIRVAMSFATNSQDIFPVWAASTLITLNEIRLPTIPNGHKYEATAITTGITGATEPTFPTTAGGTVIDGGVTWTEIGSTVLQQAGLTRANVKKDTFNWPLGGQQSSVNQAKGSYRDAKNDFALTPYRVNDPVHQAQVKKIYPLEFDGSAIDNFPQFFRIANWLLSKNREGDWFNALETGPQGLVLEEGDCICGSDDSGGLINVVTRIEELRIAPNHDVAITRARKYSTLMFSDDVGSHTIPIASTLRFVQTVDSLIEFIDTPPVREADRLAPPSGFYVSISRDLSIDGDWRGWSLWADYGDGYVKVAEGDVPATMGVTTSTLNGVSDTSVLDKKSFTADAGTDVLTATAHGFVANEAVTVRNSGGGLPGGLSVATVYYVRDVTANTFKLAATSGGTAINITSNGTGTQYASRSLTFTFDYVTDPVPFGSVTEADLVANPRKNLFLVGNEYVQAGTVVNNGNRSFTVSDLFHARFDTDSTSHAIGERVIYIDGAEAFVPTDVSRIGTAYSYKAVTTNQDVADATAMPFTWQGNILKPPKPTAFGCLFDEVSDHALFEWLGLEAIGESNRETYDLEISVPGDGDFSTVREIHDLTPNDWNQYVVWALADAELSDATVEGIDPGGLTTTLEGTFFTAQARVFSKQTFLVGRGVIAEVEIPADGLLPTNVSINPASGSYADGIFISRLPDANIPYVISVGDVTGANVTVYDAIPGDRFSVVLRPDNQAQIFLNRIGPTSTPLFISTMITNKSTVYRFEVFTTTEEFEAKSGGGVRKSTISRFTPEWLYLADAQREDNSDTLPDTIKARVRQHSFVVGGPPSDWVNGVFVRP